IAGAQYVELDGADHLPWVGDADAVVAAIERFLRHFGGERHAARMAAHPRPARAASGWGSLTEAERVIATLVAEGLSNPAIGSRLFTWGHTVEPHLNPASARRGVSSGGGRAPRALRERGKDP